MNHPAPDASPRVAMSAKLAAAVALVIAIVTGMVATATIATAESSPGDPPAETPAPPAEDPAPPAEDPAPPVEDPAPPAEDPAPPADDPAPPVPSDPGAGAPPDAPAAPAPAAPSDLVVRIAEACAKGGVSVRVTNRGDTDEVVDINGTTVTVPAGQGIRHTIPARPNETVHVVVTSGGEILFDETLRRNCSPAVLLFEVHECAEQRGDPDGIIIGVANRGDEDAVILVNGTRVTVPARTHIRHLVPAAPGETVQILVTTLDGEVIRRRTIVHNCGDPVVVVTECAANGVLVTIVNEGDVQAVPELNGTPIVVPAGGSVERLIPAAENESVPVLVTWGDNVLYDQTVSHDCQRPAVTVTDPCVANGARLTFTNSGALPVTLQVTKNGTVIDSVDVAAGGTESRTYPLSNGETATFRATGPGGFDSGPLGLTRSCATTPSDPDDPEDPQRQARRSSSSGTQVLGTTFTRTGPNPARTGSNSSDLFLVGLGLLTFGGLLVGGSRRWRHA
ncbi:MAG: hypothetical protein ACRD29_25720 [Acidimicrobiales bacterium]